MRRRLGFMTVVFLTTFFVNVSVVALSSDGEVRWGVSALVAVFTAIVLMIVFRRELTR